MRYVFPADYGDNCVLVPIDAALVPMVAGALLHFQQRGYWKTETDYQQGYNAFAELQANMTGRCIEQLIVEIRALRGGNAPASNWRDPAADPASIGLSTIGGVITETAGVGDKLVISNEKLEAIRALIEASGASTDEVEALIGQVLLALA